MIRPICSRKWKRSMGWIEIRSYVSAEVENVVQEIKRLVMAIRFKIVTEFEFMIICITFVSAVGMMVRMIKTETMTMAMIVMVARSKFVMVMTWTTKFVMVVAGMPMVAKRKAIIAIKRCSKLVGFIRRFFTVL